MENNSEMEKLRLHAERLRAEGIVDIKVDWHEGAGIRTAEERAADLNRALDARERGDYVERPPVSASRGLRELAFQLFWAWTNHPDEAFARKAWDTMLHGSTDPKWPRPADPLSVAAYERVARRSLTYLGKGIPDAD